MGAAESQLNTIPNEIQNNGDRGSSINNLWERLAAVTNGSATVEKRKSDESVVTDYHCIQNLANAFLLTNKLSSRKRHHIVNEHSNCIDQRNLIDLVCQCLDFMEEQKRNISAKDRQIIELQLEIEELKSLNQAQELTASVKLEDWTCQEQQNTFNLSTSHQHNPSAHRRRRRHQSFKQIKEDECIPASLSQPQILVQGQQPSPNVGVIAVSAANVPQHVPQTVNYKRRRVDSNDIEPRTILSSTGDVTSNCSVSMEESLSTNIGKIICAEKQRRDCVVSSIPSNCDTPLTIELGSDYHKEKSDLVSSSVFNKNSCTSSADESVTNSLDEIRLQRLRSTASTSDRKSDELSCRLISSHPYFVPDFTDSMVSAQNSAVHPYKTAEIQVPNWRILLVQKRWQIEGTEDLTDEGYEALHRKPEADERRRQKWDQQRQREAAYCARLRDKEEKKVQRAEEKAGRRLPHTILPNTDYVRRLHLTNSSFPVCPAGRCLRRFPSRQEWRIPDSFLTAVDDKLQMELVEDVDKEIVSGNFNVEFENHDGDTSLAQTLILAAMKSETVVDGNEVDNKYVSSASEIKQVYTSRTTRSRVSSSTEKKSVLLHSFSEHLQPGPATCKIKDRYKNNRADRESRSRRRVQLRTRPVLRCSDLLSLVF